MSLKLQPQGDVVRVVHDGDYLGIISEASDAKWWFSCYHACGTHGEGWDDSRAAAEGLVAHTAAEHGT